MKKRDKLFTKLGIEVDCNIIGFMEGIYGKKIVIYTTSDNESELLASYYKLKDEKVVLSEIQSDEEWDNIEKQFKEIENKLKKGNINE